MAPLQAADFPVKPVRFIVAFPPGSATDIVGRLYTARLTETWGHQVIADNRPGAGGTIAAAIAARATPDGYTLLMHSSGHTVNPTLYAKPVMLDVRAHRDLKVARTTDDWSVARGISAISVAAPEFADVAAEFPIVFVQVPGEGETTELIPVAVFGLTQGVASQLQADEVIAIPYQFINMLPYALTIVLLAIVAGRVRPPAAVGKPYEKD